MYGYVYLTTNKLDGMMYIGKRKGEFCASYLGSGLRLKNAIKYHGRSAFIVVLLEVAESADELNNLEKSFIMEFDAVNSRDFYNIADGGEGGMTYLDRSRHIGPRMKKSAEKYADLETMLKSMSQSEIASILKVDQSAVAQRIRDHNIKVIRSDEYHHNIHRKRVESAKLAHEARRSKSREKWKDFDVEQMYKTMTQKQIAEKIGMSQVRVSQYIREHGFKK